MSVILPIALIGAAAIALLTYVLLANKKRRREFAAWAKKHAFTSYDPTPELSWLSHFEAWGPGRGHRATAGYRGTHGGYPVRVFSHQSVTGNINNSRGHLFIIVMFETPFAAPRLRIKREHFGHKIIDALGAEDINFESGEFSRKYWVKCKDRKFAYDVLHPRAMEHLMNTPKAQWEWQGRRLVLHVAGILKPSRANPLLNAATPFLDLVPAHLEAS